MQLPESWAENAKVQEFVRSTRRLTLFRAIRNVLQKPTSTLTDALIDDLLETWGDSSMYARDPFLRSVMVEVASASSPILQCGASALTLLIGIVCHKLDKHLWVLEHSTHWANVVRTRLKHYGVSNTHIITAPADMFDGYVWYGIDLSRFPKDFSLVVCDGSSAQPSGLRGVLDNLPDHLADRAVLLCRDMRKSRDLKYVASWAKERNAAFVKTGKQEPYVKVAMPDQSKPVAHDERLNTVYGDRSLPRH